MRLGTWMMVLGACWLGAAMAQAAQSKAEGLPAGHPDISKMSPTSRPASELPAGHPDISKMPAATQPAGNMELPAGHPTVSGMKRPTTGPAATVGKLTVLAKQSTKGGPTLAGQTIAVDLYHRSQPIKTIEAKLDAKGGAVLENLPILLPVRPLVRMVHGGVQYQSVGELMDGYNATQTVEVSVFETTEEAPPLTVQGRQAVVEFGDDGLHVSEILSFANRSDKTWLGVPQPEGRRTSVGVSLPAEATQLDLGGMDDAYTKTADGKLLSVMPLMPGASRMTFSYVIPAKNGGASVTFTAPYDVVQMMVFVEEGGRVHVEGLQAAPPHNMGQIKALIYKGMNLKAGHVGKLTIQMPAKKADAGAKK